MEQPTEIDEELPKRRKIGERQEEQENQRGADQIDIEGRPLPRRLVADGAFQVEPAQFRTAMGTESRSGHGRLPEALPIVRADLDATSAGDVA